MRSLYYYAHKNKVSIFLLALILFLLPFELIPRFEIYGATVRLSQLAALALVIINYKTIWLNRNELIKNPWIWLVVFIIVSTISSLFAISTKKAFMTTSFYLFSFILAFTIAKVFRAKESNLYTKIVLLTSLFIVGICVYQFFGDTFGLSTSVTLISDKYSKLIFGFPRVRGLSIEPLYLANFLIIPLGLSLSLVYFKAYKYSYILSAVFLTSIWLTVARGAYLAAGVMLLVLTALMFWHKMFKEFLVLAGVVLLSILLSFSLIWASGRFAKQLPVEKATQTEFDTTIPTEGITAEGNTDRLLEHTTDFSSETSFTDRAKTAKTALELSKQYPLLGVGPGNFGRYVVKTYPQTFTDINQIANNEPLEILSEVGILGLLSIAGFAACCVIYSWRYKFKQHDIENNIWFLATSLILVGFVVQWQTFSTLYVTHIWVMIGIFLASSKLINKTK